MRYLVGSFLLVLMLVGFASAANLRIVGYDVVWSSTNDPSPAYHVLILNEQGVSDRLAGWQLCLIIIPTQGATGVLQFTSADLPRQPSENYLLAGDSATLDGSDPPPSPLIVGPTDTLLLGDYALSGFGSEVPASEKMLLKVDFAASEGAQGEFAIAVVPGQENSFWASFDTNDSSEMTRGFQGIPLEGDPVVIAKVIVNSSIPEPNGFHLLLAGAILTLGHRTRRGHSKQQRWAIQAV